MSEMVLVAVIGAAGTIVGAVTTLLVASIQAAQKASQAAEADATDRSPIILGHALDIRELRILRALFGEPNGRLLEAYKDSYYRPALNAVTKKGWVKQIQGRVYMTTEGAEFCRAYLKQEISAWKPADPFRS